MFWRELQAELRNKILTPDKLAIGFSRLIDVILVVGGAVLIYLLLRLVTRRLLRKARSGHAATYINVMHSLSGYVMFFVALVLVLRVFGVNYTAILAGAGVVGLAVGFGAQALIRDFLSGFFLILEDLIGVGDYITVAGIEGNVEVVGLRVTKVRAFDGTLHVVPNGELTRFGNRNRGHMRAIVMFDLPYEQDAGRGMDIAREAADQWYKENADAALEPPAIAGLLNFGESGAQIRASVKVRPGQQWAAEQQLRLGLKRALESAGAELPVPRHVVYVRTEPPANAGSDS